ncbi:peptide-methionine (S)-S-oxide reductase [Cytobacillus firmus]|uniref:peptide-methionine (S)-S-oxide reductase n=2 Tax=Cytobacillus TaxID=2675230 RepID=A0A366JD58_CYTFI|nr:peptide-methionine (S)-S-oxide reductase [Cytobacillus firmus]TDX36349.1 peptide-methionine (S)-S-oxide reductase [Cytobacillus oceanisediminis]
MDTVTFGMGCFWGPESRFGYHPGVIRTRVGYAGGKEGQPTSRNTLDYTETLHIQYDSNLLSLDQILTQFFEQHNTTRAPRSIKYRSVLFYQSEEQKEKMLQKVERIKQIHGRCYTSVEPLDTFYEAEIRHQKYYLQRWKPVYEKLQQLEGKEFLVDSTLAARLNGLSKDCGSLQEMMLEFSDSDYHTLWSVIEEVLKETKNQALEACDKVCKSK